MIWCLFGPYPKNDCWLVVAVINLLFPLLLLMLCDAHPLNNSILHSNNHYLLQAAVYIDSVVLHKTHFFAIGRLTSPVFRDQERYLSLFASAFLSFMLKHQNSFLSLSHRDREMASKSDMTDRSGSVHPSPSIHTVPFIRPLLVIPSNTLNQCSFHHYFSIIEYIY